MGYRRPKNLRDLLVHANIPRLLGDELVDPNYVAPPAQVITLNPAINNTLEIPGVTRQPPITEYFVQGAPVSATPATSQPVATITGTSKRLGTNPANRGFAFCKHNICRFCPKINKTGKIFSKTTGLELNCMKKVSCRSSNLIYCITCKRCGLQYVGQTLLRVKDRLGQHFTSIDNYDTTKSIGRHFSQTNHNGLFDIEISVLEFIKKPPKSEAAKIIRDRVERRWIQVLRTKAPQGLNIED